MHVKLAAEHDRRKYRRYPQTLDVVLRPLPPLDLDRSKQTRILGRIQDISQGGICLLTPHPVVPPRICLCEFELSDLPIKVTTLMRVCWSRKETIQGEGYFSGLAFLL